MRRCAEAPCAAGGAHTKGRRLLCRTRHGVEDAKPRTEKLGTLQQCSYPLPGAKTGDERSVHIQPCGVEPLNCFWRTRFGQFCSDATRHTTRFVPCSISTLAGNVSECQLVPSGAVNGSGTLIIDDLAMRNHVSDHRLGFRPVSQSKCDRVGVGIAIARDHRVAMITGIHERLQIRLQGSLGLMSSRPRFYPPIRPQQSSGSRSAARRSQWSATA